MNTIYRRPRRKQQSGQVLILGLLVVVAIIAILYHNEAKMLGRNEYDASGGVKGAPTAMDSAYDVACTQYQNQVAMAAGMYRSDNHAPPPDLESLKRYGVTEDMINTPNCNFGLPKQAGAAGQAQPAGQMQQGGQGGYGQGGWRHHDNPGQTTVVGPGGMPIHVPNSAGGGMAGYGGGGGGDAATDLGQ